MKSLKPSMRENKRYLLIKSAKTENLKENVEKAILDFAGVRGMSKTGPSWIKDNIICINREAVDLVRASLVVFPEKIEVLRVSGTLKGLGKK